MVTTFPRTEAFVHMGMYPCSRVPNFLLHEDFDSTNSPIVIRFIMVICYLLLIIQVNVVRMLKGERILSASHDGSVKMWDIRIDSCVATVGKSQSPILCMDYDDSTGMLAAAGVDGYVSYPTWTNFWKFLNRYRKII